MMVQSLMLQGNCGCKYPRATRNERGHTAPELKRSFTLFHVVAPGVASDVHLLSHAAVRRAVVQALVYTGA
jgi:hypothetical protein